MSQLRSPQRPGGGAGAGPGLTHVRFAMRATELRSGSRRRALWGIGVLLLVGGLVWVVLFSPVLAVRTVRVEGLSATSSAATRQRTHALVGTPLLRLDTAAIADEVLASGVLAEVSVTPVMAVDGGRLREPSDTCARRQEF